MQYIPKKKKSNHLANWLVNRSAYQLQELSQPFFLFAVEVVFDVFGIVSMQVVVGEGVGGYYLIQVA